MYDLRRRRICALCSYIESVPYILYNHANHKPKEIVGFYGCKTALDVMYKYNKERKKMSYQDLVPERKAVDDTIKDLGPVLEKIGWNNSLSSITEDQIKNIIITILNSYRDHLHDHIGEEDKVKDYLNVHGVEIPTNREDIPFDDKIPWME